MVSFDDEISVGKVGSISMKHQVKRDAIKELQGLQMGNQSIRQAAEVALGRLDINELGGGHTAQAKAEEVS